MSLDAARARWHQSGVIPSSIVALAAGLPTPELVSEQSSPVVRDYLLQWIADANPAGVFYAETRWLQEVPESLRLPSLFARGYDGLIYVLEGEPIAHVCYQRRGSSLNSFAVAVVAPMRGKGYSVPMFLDFVSYAQGVPGVGSARVGGGQNNVARGFLECAKPHEEQLGWQVSPDGLVSFTRSPESQLRDTVRVATR